MMTTEQGSRWLWAEDKCKVHFLLLKVWHVNGKFNLNLSNQTLNSGKNEFNICNVDTKSCGLKGLM